MSNIKLKSSNWNLSMGVTISIITYGIISVFIPIFFIRFIPQSTIGNYFLDHIFILTVFYFVISIYFTITGCYYYIKIDAYIMYITSYRTISGLLKDKNYIEVPHDMLRKYSFFNRPFTFNKTLMLKIQDASGKKIIKRFDLSFLSKSEEGRISKVLDQIIAKNS